MLHKWFTPDFTTFLISWTGSPLPCFKVPPISWTLFLWSSPAVYLLYSCFPDGNPEKSDTHMYVPVKLGAVDASCPTLLKLKTGCPKISCSRLQIRGNCKCPLKSPTLVALNNLSASLSPSSNNVQKELHNLGVIYDCVIVFKRSGDGKLVLLWPTETADQDRVIPSLHT